MHHRRISPAGGAFDRHDGGDRRLLAAQDVGLELPAARRHHALVGEVVDLHEGVVPVLADQLALLAQQLERRLVLRLVQLVRILDAQGRVLLHQVQRRVGDVDRPVEGLHAALVALAVGQRLLLEHHVPAGRLLVAEDLGVVHQHIPAPLVRHAVVGVVLVVPRRLLQPGIDVLVARDQVDVDRLHLLAADQPRRGVARGGDQVEAALVHQRHHLVAGAGGLDVDLAAGLLLEVGDPVEGLVGGAAFDVAGPGHDVDLALGLADGLQHLLRERGHGEGHRDSGDGGQRRNAACHG